jgi:hypothetical protein
MLIQMADPEFAKQMQDNKGSIYLVQLLLPATFENIPVNAPAWARHLADAQATGKKFNPATEAATTVQHIGVLNLPQTLSQGLGGLGPSLSGALGAISGAVGDRLNSDLDRSAALYDGNLNQ